MQYVQDASLINIMISFLFSNSNVYLFPFTWDLIGYHEPKFKTEYDYEDARCLLQLSLMITESNYLDKPLDTPSWLEDTSLIYDKCPLELISKGIPKSPLNKSANIGHILYSESANILFIAFTGTINICMAGLDLAYSQNELNGILNYVQGLKAHHGVYLAYQSIRPKLVETVLKYLPKKPQIIITGHSLGGAL